MRGRKVRNHEYWDTQAVIEYEEYLDHLPEDEFELHLLACSRRPKIDPNEELELTERQSLDMNTPIRQGSRR